MKRLVFLVMTGAVVTFAIWYVGRVSQEISSASVSALLPRETIFVAHLPDFKRTRDQWDHSDICLLYREPAVRDFLRRPQAEPPEGDAASQTLGELEQLDPKNVFFALTSMDNNSPKFVGGFRFRGTSDDAERVIGKWRSKFSDRNPTAKREKLQYEHHEIEMIAATPFVLATTYDRPWFFAATDLTELKALLDRADGRVKTSKETLHADESYRAAAAHMPSNYAASLYLQPKTFSERIAALRAVVQSPSGANQGTLLEEVRSICGATRFENGKIRDLLFVGMPKLEPDSKLTQSSLMLGTKDTCFYLSMLLNVGQKIETINQAVGVGGKVIKSFQAFSDSGITADDWKAAFGPEFGSLADWPPSTQWPSLLLSLSVMDVTKAGKIVDVLTHADEESIWTETEKDGVRYFSMQSPASLIAITPTIALSGRILVAGLNPVSVEEAVKRSAGTSSDLSDSKTYKAAARLVPNPTNFFAYIDTALLYSRLDAALRPILLMAAVFTPAVTDYVDLGKLPAPEVITRHLSPIVSSQRYDRDGYVAESVGPLTLDQSIIGLTILSGVGTAARQRVSRAGLAGSGPSLTGTPQPNLNPSPTPDLAPTP